MKALVIAERPSVARDIARVLKCTKNGNGFTEGGRYVDVIYVGDKKTTGRAVREQALGLRSAAFEIDYDADSDEFTFTTYGYDHGVGMSQTGANLYANEEGWDYIEILEHYYPGCRVR